MQNKEKVVQLVVRIFLFHCVFQFLPPNYVVIRLCSPGGPSLASCPPARGPRALFWVHWRPALPQRHRRHNCSVLLARSCCSPSSPSLWEFAVLPPRWGRLHHTSERRWTFGSPTLPYHRLWGEKKGRSWWQREGRLTLLRGVLDVGGARRVIRSLSRSLSNLTDGHYCSEMECRCVTKGAKEVLLSFSKMLRDVRGLTEGSGWFARLSVGAWPLEQSHWSSS